jgi:hypothetical protein
MAARMIEAVLCEKRSPTAGPASISRACGTGTQCADFERAAGAAMDYVIQVANADRAALGDGMGRVCSPSPVERWGRFIDDLDEGHRTDRFRATRQRAYGYPSTSAARQAHAAEH